MVTLKLNLNINQLVAADLFLGYHKSNWNSRMSYFLIGKRRSSHIFNMHYTYFAIKRVLFLLSDLFFKKCHVWLINENFSFFGRSKIFSYLSKNVSELYFYNSKWYKGFLSNCKFIRFFKHAKFPHLIAVPNIQNNHYVVNEARIINIPSVALTDTIDNPINVFYAIPGNSKSIKSTLLFYLLFSKSAFYSRYLSSSSFFFSFFKKSKMLFSSLSNPNFLRSKQASSFMSMRVLNWYQKGFLINSFRIGKLFIRKFVRPPHSFSGVKCSFFWKSSFTFSIYFYLNALQLSIFRVLSGGRYAPNKKNSIVKTIVALFL